MELAQFRTFAHTARKTLTMLEQGLFESAPINGAKTKIEDQNLKLKKKKVLTTRDIRLRM